MAIKNTLEKILCFGLAENYFTISTIGALEKTCCKNSNVDVIDFDLTEIKRRKLGFSSMKSCDAIKILIQKERIDFIEMKSTKNIIKNKSIKSKEKLEKQIDKFDFVS